MKVLEVLRRGYLKNKRELPELTHDKRNLRKILFTGWHDHFIDHKYHFLRFLAAHTSSLFNLTQMNHVVICSTNLPNHSFKRKILHQEFSACLHETLYEHIHPIPKVRKIFHIPWRCLPKNLGVFPFRLVLPLSEISFKHNHFLGASIKNCLSKCWIKILPKPTLQIYSHGNGKSHRIFHLSMTLDHVAVNFYLFFISFYFFLAFACCVFLFPFLGKALNS